MVGITKGGEGGAKPEVPETGAGQGAPAEVDSPGGYGGDDRAQSESGPLKPEKG